MHTDFVMKSNLLLSTNVPGDPYGVRESVCFIPLSLITQRLKNAHPFWGHSLHTNPTWGHPYTHYPRTKTCKETTPLTGIPTYYTLHRDTHISHPHHKHLDTKPRIPTVYITHIRTVYVPHIHKGSTHPIRNNHTWIPL